MTGCSGSEKVHTFFEAGATTDPSTGNLIVAQGNGNATNVQIGLLNSDMTNIKAGADDASQNSKPVEIKADAATLNYVAEYVATGQVQPGAVKTSVTYTIAYD